MLDDFNTCPEESSVHVIVLKIGHDTCSVYFENTTTGKVIVNLY